MNDILIVCSPLLVFGALIGISAIVSGIHGLITAKRENEIKLAVNKFTDVTWKDGDEMQRSVFDFDRFYDWLYTLDIDYPQFVFVDETDVKYNQTWVHIYNENKSQKLASFHFNRSDVECNPEACIDKIVDWCSNYIPQETCCENRLEPKPMKPMTCEKCGAPLKGCECEYCGTRYYIPNNEYETLYADGKAIMQVKKNLSEVQNMADQLRILGGNGSIEYMLNSGAINAATAREMYMTKMVSCFKD